MSFLSNIVRTKGLKVADKAMNPVGLGVFDEQYTAPVQTIRNKADSAYQDVLGYMWDQKMKQMETQRKPSTPPSYSMDVPTLTDQQLQAGTKIVNIGGKPHLYIPPNDLETRKQYNNAHGYVPLGR